MVVHVWWWLQSKFGSLLGLVGLFNSMEFMARF